MVAALLLLVMLWSLIFVTIWVASNHLSGMLVQGATIKNNPLGKIHYLSYCNKFFHKIYSFHRGGF